VRVALDARLLAYQSAGTATYIRGLLQGLDELGAGPEVVVLASRKESNRSAWAGHPVRRLWTPCHHRWERWTLGLELLRDRFDVLHSPDFIPPARLGRRWARVITVHDLAFLRYPELLTNESRRYYGQIGRAVDAAERIIAVSEATRRDLLELVSATAAPRIVVIPEGVEPAFRRLDRQAATRQVAEAFGLAGPFFLFVGTREPRKNLARLLRAFGQFWAQADQPDVTMAIAGSRGWLDDDVEKAAEALGPRCRLLGRVEQPDLVALYNAAVALIFVSLYEGFGLPALEAMACGCPVLASSTSSLPELVGDAGFLVDPLDEDAIAAALARISADPQLRAELSARGQERAGQFTWETVGRQTAEVYRQAVACAS
jgi:glycosyltransferase involved in cell wall biosynthesis